MKKDTLLLRYIGIVITLFLIFFISVLRGQEEIDFVPREIINLPTAGTLNRGEVGVNLRLYPHGGLLSGFSAGVSDPFFVTVYFGGENIIGVGDVNWNPQIAVDLRYRIIDETFELPALSIGFTNQGYGAYIKKKERYAIKSRGFYIVSSKNYNIVGNAGFHLGANFSLETKDQDTDINFFMGFDKDLIKNIVLLCEYDLALNDNEDQSFTNEKGYLNAGIRWGFLGRFFLEFYFKDLLENRIDAQGVTREVKIEFVENLFR